MKFLVEVNQGSVTEYFNTIDYIKDQLFKANNEMVEHYQALLEQYQDNLNNIIIERG